MGANNCIGPRSKAAREHHMPNTTCHEMRRMRLAELVGTLSMATDAGTGMPDHHALRGAIVAVRLAEQLNADDTTVRDCYYLPLLALCGCSAESHAASDALGDEVAIGVETFGLD